MHQRPSGQKNQVSRRPFFLLRLRPLPVSLQNGARKSLLGKGLRTLRPTIPHASPPGCPPPAGELQLVSSPPGIFQVRDPQAVTLRGSRERLG